MIPQWDWYQVGETPENNKQLKFYEKWLSELEKGNLIDLGKNLGYLKYYIYSLVNQFVLDKNINNLIDCLNKVEEVYNHDIVKKFVVDVKSDAFFYLGDYQKSLDIKQEIGFVGEDVLRFSFVMYRDKINLIDGEFLVNTSFEEGLTPFGIENKKAMVDCINKSLNDFEVQNGKNFFMYYLGDELSTYKLDFNSLLYVPFNRGELNLIKNFIPRETFLKLNKEYEEQKDFPWCPIEIDIGRLDNNKLKKICKYLHTVEEGNLTSYYDLRKAVPSTPRRYTIFVSIKRIDDNDLKFLEKISLKKKEFKDLKQKYEEENNRPPNNAVLVPEEVFRHIPGIVHIYGKKSLFLMSNKKYFKSLKKLLRDSENSFRISRGLPKIGEGWVSETELYYKLKEAFPDEKVIHHGNLRGWVDNIWMYISQIKILG